MATEFSQDSVLDFLCRRGGKVKNADLLRHFHEFLRDPEKQAQNRDLFKRFVNSVAVVKNEGGVSYVVLKRRYGDLVPDFSSAVSSSGETEDSGLRETFTNRRDLNRKPEKGQSFKPSDSRAKRKASEKPGVLNALNEHSTLCSAGFVNNNVAVANPRVSGASPVLYTTEKTPSSKTDVIKSHCISQSSPVSIKPTLADYSEKSFRAAEVSVSKAERPTAPIRSKQPAFNGDTNENMCSAKTRQSEAAESKHSQESKDCERKSFSHPAHPCNQNKALVNADFIENNPQRHCNERVGHRALDSARSLWSSHSRLPAHPRISGSSPCVSAFPAAQNGLVATQATARSTSHLSSPGDLQASSSIWCKLSANSGEEGQISLRPLHYDLPPEAPIRPSAKTSALCSRSGLSASHGNLLRPTYTCAEDAESPQRLPGDEWGSIDGLNSKGLAGTRQSKVLDMLQRAERKVDDWHGLMGNFPSQDTWASPLGGEAGPPVPLRAGNRKEKDKLRSRKCRSMGADLDSSFPGEETSGKHSRLLLLSSSLGLSRALAPRARAQSYREISQGDASRARPVAAQEGAYRYRSTPVPLDSREHDWLVKAAAGTWTEIYSLFREQPSLLSKKDFVSGYTVLHWIAKHGDHQVLNTLWYGVSKAGLELDVNVKSSCGYTPLHIAAIHGHKKLIRVLVHKFKANPSLRDTSGKRPWHYLARTGPADLLQLLGAPQNQYLPSTAQQFVLDRPALPTAAVKRHSSFAVFHKKFSKLQAASTISESAV